MLRGIHVAGTGQRRRENSFPRWFFSGARASRAARGKMGGFFRIFFEKYVIISKNTRLLIIFIAEGRKIDLARFF